MEVNGIYEGLGGDLYATRCCDLGQEFARSNLRISELDVRKMFGLESLHLASGRPNNFDDPPPAAFAALPLTATIKDLHSNFVLTFHFFFTLHYPDRMDQMLEFNV